MAEVFDELYLVLIVAAFLVYLVMAAQFESFLHPFIIISSLPLALSGSVIALKITGNGLSIPAIIGGVVLVGILVNSGIIMVDFINQLRNIHGLPLKEAIIDGATARLRPILMTTLTTILGLVPLSLGLGQGSQLQAPMAIAVIGGMTSGTILLLGFVPALYYLLNRR
jgi:HAE1 family hydrophobic/amphiphilic exporter-1